MARTLKFLMTATLVAASRLAGSAITLPPELPGSEAGQVFLLQDYRWVPIIVRRAPTAIDCAFSVINGSPTVHAELISEHDFALFSRNHDYETLAKTQTGRAGGFHHMIETPGQYLVVIMNDRGAQQVAVSLTVRTNVDPAPLTRSIGVSPERKLVVILASLTLFLGTVSWSGRKLLRAYRNR